MSDLLSSAVELVLSEKNPVEMEDILCQIFVFLNVKTLKEVRLVCQVWREVATKEMMRKAYVRIPHIFLNKHLGLLWVSPFHGQEKMEAFFSRNIVRKIYIESPFETSAYEQIKIFRHFGLIGDQVRVLKYGAKPDQDLLELLNSLPNLVHYVNYYDDDLLCTDGNGVKILMEAGKIFTLRDFQFFPKFHSDTGLSNFETIEAFANCDNVKLERFSIGFIRAGENWWPRIVASLNKLLPSNADTLKDLSLWQPTGHLPGFVLPMLKKLTYLRVDLQDIPASGPPGRRRVFPESFRFSKNFPTLNQVKLTIRRKYDGDHPIPVENYDHVCRAFPRSAGVAPTVKIMVIDSDFLHNPHLTRIFPNVESLDIRCVENLKDIRNFNWSRWTGKIQKLIIFNYSHKIPVFPLMDEIVTGLSEEAVRAMVKNPQLTPHLDLVPRNSSIFYLNCLKSLKIHLAGDLDSSEDGILMSDVCGNFCFNSKPEMSVDLHMGNFTATEEQFFRMKAALASTSKLPNVSIKISGHNSMSIDIDSMQFCTVNGIERH